MSFVEEAAQTGFCLERLFSKSPASPCASEASGSEYLSSCPSTDSEPCCQQPVKRVSFAQLPDIRTFVPLVEDFLEYGHRKLADRADSILSEHAELLERLRKNLSFIEFAAASRKPQPAAQSVAEKPTAYEQADEDDEYDGSREVQWFRQANLYKKATDSGWVPCARGELELVEDTFSNTCFIELTENAELTTLLRQPILFDTVLRDAQGKETGCCFQLLNAGAEFCFGFDTAASAAEFRALFESFRQRARAAALTVTSRLERNACSGLPAVV